MPCHSRGPGTLIGKPQEKLIAGIHTRTLDLSSKISSLPIRTTLLLPQRQFSTWGQDRLEGHLSSYSGPCDIWKYFHFVTAGKTYQLRVLPFGFSAAPREFTKTLALLVQLLLHIQQTIQLLQTLGWTFNWKKSILEPSCILDLLGLQSRTSNCFSSRLLFRFSHQCPFPSISIQGHAYMQDNFYKWSDLALCPVYQHRRLHLSFLQFWMKTPVTTHTALGHSDPTGFGISHTSTLVQLTRSSSRSPIASPGAHPVLLHQCIANRIGSQLADSSSLSTVVTSRVLPTYQLAGTWSDTIGLTSVVTPVYVSHYPDNRAWAVDSLSISWDGLVPVYAFPPAPIVLQTLQVFPWYHSDPHRISIPVSALASSAT